MKIVVGVFLSLLLALTYADFAENTPQSTNEQSKTPKTKSSVDSGWLPNITGLPSPEAVDGLTKNIAEVMEAEQDARCKSIDYNLKMLALQNFVIYQSMANAQGVYFDEKIAYKYAHTLAMILKESGGDSTNVTDMTGRTMTTNKARTNIDRWNNILKLTLKNRIKLNYQTNFGLTQLSTDRLFIAFSLVNGKGHKKDFLEGKYGAQTPNKVDLDTAIAIRRLIWLYQDFSQGRIAQDYDRIPEEYIYTNEFNQRYQTGLKLALLYCGTQFMFKEDQQYHWTNEYSSFEDAIASIAYCKLGNSKEGYGKTKINEECFAQWVTLCPALNINIALITPLEYFATKNEKPVCQNVFNSLINKDPNGSKESNDH